MVEDDDPDGEWEFSLSDVGVDGVDDEDDEDEGQLRPGSPKIEHVVFVCLGVLATLFAVFRVLVG